jgi:hypothetical protein
VREATAKTKARNAGALLTTFEATHPDIAAWWNNTSFAFAIAMRDAVAQYGDLTPRQFAATCRCIESDKARKAASQARANAAQPLDTSALVAAFDHAGAADQGKRIKLRFAGFSVAPAKATSANAGALYVKAGAAYLGKIVNGKFFASRDCSPTQEAEFRAVCVDPKAAAVAYGRKTGSCSCCGRELTRADSIALGIGPICAGRFGW